MHLLDLSSKMTMTMKCWTTPYWRLSLRRCTRPHTTQRHLPLFFDITDTSDIEFLQEKKEHKLYSPASKSDANFSRAQREGLRSSTKRETESTGRRPTQVAVTVTGCFWGSQLFGTMAQTGGPSMLLLALADTVSWGRRGRKRPVGVSVF